MSSYMVQPKNLFDVDFATDSREEWIDGFAEQVIGSLSIYSFIDDYHCHYYHCKHTENFDLDGMMKRAICGTASLRNEYERRLELYIEHRKDAILSFFGNDYDAALARFNFFCSRYQDIDIDDIEHPDIDLLAWMPDSFNEEEQVKEIRLFDKAFLLSLQESKELMELAQKVAKWYAETVVNRLSKENQYEY